AQVLDTLLLDQLLEIGLGAFGNLDHDDGNSGLFGNRTILVRITRMMNTPGVANRAQADRPLTFVHAVPKLGISSRDPLNKYARASPVCLFADHRGASEGRLVACRAGAPHAES